MLTAANPSPGSRTGRRPIASDMPPNNGTATITPKVVAAARSVITAGENPNVWAYEGYSATGTVPVATMIVIA